MKIAIRDTYRQAGCRGGIGYYTIFLAEALSKIVEEVDVYTAEPDIFPGCRVVGDESIFNCSRLRRGIRLLNKMVCPDIDSSDYACIIFPHLMEPLVHTAKAKRVVVVYDLISLLTQRSSLRSIFYYLHYRYNVGRILSEVDKIVTLSESTKNDLLRNYHLEESRIQVIPSGFNYRLASFRSENDRDRTSLQKTFGDYVLYIGNSLPHKNLKRLIQAISLVREHIDINLLLVGSNETRAYRNVIKQCGLKSSVKFLGVVSEDQLAKFLCEARALVQPSLYEGFGLTPLEAMINGVPVAVSRCSSLPEVCGQAAVYFDPLDVQNMAKTIENVLTNAEVRRQCREKGFAQAKKFEWSMTARKYVEMISAL